MGIYDKPFLRLTIEGIFYRLRVGCPWRDNAVDLGSEALASQGGRRG